MFAKLLANNKATCNNTVNQYCFMVAFGYNIQVRQNTFSHIIPIEGKLQIANFSIQWHHILESCHNLARELNELEWINNLYTPGLLLPSQSSQRQTQRSEPYCFWTRPKVTSREEQCESSLPAGNDSKKQSRGYQGYNYNPNYFNKHSQNCSWEYGGSGQRGGNSGQTFDKL